MIDDRGGADVRRRLIPVASSRPVATPRPEARVTQLRFADHQDHLVAAEFHVAKIDLVDWTPIEVTTVLRDFEDYWHPFTLGAGPAPGYCVNLEPEARQRLRERS